MKGRGARDAILIGFDLLHLNGEDLRRRPVEVRRARLAALLIAPADGLQFSQAIEAGGAVIFRHACAMGLEGIVSKRTGSK